MPKLSDTQLVILSAAARRQDGAVLPLPRSLKVNKAAATRPGIGPWELGARRPRTPIRGRRSFDWTSRAKEALLWGNGPEGYASGPPAPTG